MDQRERNADLEEVVRIALDGLRANLWTSLPCVVESYDPVKLTVVCTPTVKVSLRSADGTFSWVTIPLLRDVPVVFPSGGGFAITWPIQEGDEVLVVFASRCIDGWWAYGGVQLPSELRFNTLDDGFAFPGPRSLPRALSSVNTASLQVRSADGTTYLEIAPGGIINLVAPNGVNINGDVRITGKVTVTKEGTFGTATDPPGILVTSHIHGGVTPGGGTSGVPVP